MYLEELPGEPLDRAIGGLDLAGAMAQLGSLHRELQELDVRGLPDRRASDWLTDAQQAVTRIELFVPSIADRARTVYAELERTAPADGPLLFCQGDFLPGQILCDPSGWSVIDFDDSRYADPLSEVAAMYAALPRTLGLSPEQADLARRSYVDAYADRVGEPVDQGRWRWFLVLLQLAELGKRLIKGRVDPAEIDAVLDRLDAAVG
jgi:aminoglycoside phosphotransferase (APT) family kinase protein